LLIYFEGSILKNVAEMGNAFAVAGCCSSAAQETSDSLYGADEAAAVCRADL
jgi:hypothetical protein